MASDWTSGLTDWIFLGSELRSSLSSICETVEIWFHIYGFVEFGSGFETHRHLLVLGFKYWIFLEWELQIKDKVLGNSVLDYRPGWNWVSKIGCLCNMGFLINDGWMGMKFL